MRLRHKSAAMTSLRPSLAVLNSIAVHWSLTTGQQTAFDPAIPKTGNSSALVADWSLRSPKVN